MSATAGRLGERLADIVGPGAVRPPARPAAFDWPAALPASPAQIAELLRFAAADRIRVVPTGAGTKLSWIEPPAGAGFLLSTERLSGVDAHDHGDLTATIQAGTPLLEANRRLAAEGQWLPLDPLTSDAATLGGVVATNDAGPRRHRYGSPRDVIIGVEFVTSDGLSARAGGRVVKNVAGYDLGRLLTGSYGCLAVMTRLTFKLTPIARASRTAVAQFDRPDDLQSAVQALLVSQLAPTAIELAAFPLRLLVRFESVEASAGEQAAVASELAREHRGSVAAALAGEEERELWDRHRARLWDGPGTMLRAGVPPAHLAEVVRYCEKAPGGVSLTIGGRAGAGVWHLRMDGPVASIPRAVEELRRLLTRHRGYLELLRADARVRAAVDPLGVASPVAGLMQAVKTSFDPGGVLVDGRWKISAAEAGSTRVEAGKRSR